MYTAPQIQSLIGQYWPIIALVGIWTFVWKALALWKSARMGSRVWFVIFLLVNTVGILEIIYIYFIAKRRRMDSSVTAS